MPTRHLTKGDPEPERYESIMRLYSMEFCPYSHRARLILKVKRPCHGIVNINVTNKPDWYYRLSPEGIVPILLHEDEIVSGSLEICDYLDDILGKCSLYSETFEKDKELVDKIQTAVDVFERCLFGNEEKTPEEWLNELLVPLQPFEEELAARGTKFFGEEGPGMVDYMLWPWAERSGTLALKLGEKLPIKSHQIPLLRRWKKDMRQDEYVDRLYWGPEVYWKFAQYRIRNEDPEYDSIVPEDEFR